PLAMEPRALAPAPTSKRWQVGRLQMVQSVESASEANCAHVVWEPGCLRTAFVLPGDSAVLDELLSLPASPTAAILRSARHACHRASGSRGCSGCTACPPGSRRRDAVRARLLPPRESPPSTRREI